MPTEQSLTSVCTECWEWETIREKKKKKKQKKTQNYITVLESHGL